VYELKLQRYLSSITVNITDHCDVIVSNSFSYSFLRLFLYLKLIYQKLFTSCEMVFSKEITVVEGSGHGLFIPVFTWRDWRNTKNLSGWQVWGSKFAGSLE